MCKCVRSLLSLSILSSILFLPALAQGDNNPPPLRRVTLYKHGVGYFERQGKVNGDQQVTFLFDAAQMNDVLKSLVALDLGRGPNQADRGKISSVTFDSIKPVDKRLEEFGISLDSTNAMGMTSLLGQLKGARVEVRAGANPASGSITGVVVGIEKRARMLGAERTEAQELVLIDAAGELRSIALDQVRGIKLLDAKLREDLEQYLSILQSTIHKNLRKLTISTTGQGERDLFLSYVVEAPVWKTTYRVVLDPKSKPFLQGWALVDNVQDEDWTDVTLSLVSGAPISFIQDLQQPRFKRRPVVGMPEDLTIAPQIPQASIGSTLGMTSGGGALEGVIRDAAGSAIANATIRVTQTSTGAEITATTDGNGRYRLRGLPAGTYRVKVDSPGFKSVLKEQVSLSSATLARNDFTLDVGSVSETVTISASKIASLPLNGRNYSSLTMMSPGAVMKSEDSGVEADVETQDIGELFEYRIAHPVTIKRNSSALIPILQSQVEGESVSLYNQKTRGQNPMSALYLNNTTGLTLESGPLTIIENDTYAGEALTGRIKPDEKRFITYAVDLGCRVSVKEDKEDQKVYLAEIINGEFRLSYKQMKTTVYTLNNLTDRAKTVYIEHPYDKDEKWQLVKTVKPVETTEEYHRFKVIVAPKATTQFSVSEELPESNTYALSNITTTDIQIFVKSNYLTPQMKQALDGVADLKTQISQLARQIAEKQSEINTITRDQERMRENLRALGKTEEEKQLVQRYVAKISQGEDQLERLRQEEKRLQEERNNLQRQLDERVKKLAMDHRLN